MSFKFAQPTPGAWRYNKQNDFVTAYLKPKEPVICQISRIQEYMANAALIESAPNLLEALKDIAGYNDTDGNSPMCGNFDDCVMRAQKALSLLVLEEV